jgi:hypothetical protein
MSYTKPASILTTVSERDPFCRCIWVAGPIYNPKGNNPLMLKVRNPACPAVMWHLELEGQIK